MKKYIPDILFVTGLVLITAGIFMFNISAGIIAGGLSLIVWSVLMAKGGDGQ